MDFGIITKEIVCTVKDPKLESIKLFVVRFLKLDKSERNEYIVCAENRLGLGIGDYVLVIKGSPSRQLEGNTDIPVDSAISAKVDSIFIDDKYKYLI
ncbi:MAG: EutN/CcmL family microcompartment protein [Actinobacteria bacterium]|nr:EutN/CcmL family microcompartment protein [Actinomycetota bacterium]MCL6088435.1 EutN/CcmL family microcompartment protein [Actinomycetota bacterium]